MGKCGNLQPCVFKHKSLRDSWGAKGTVDHRKK